MSPALTALALWAVLPAADPADAPAPPTVAQLVARLKDDSPRTRRLAAEALGRRGAKAEDAVPVLVTVLRGDKEDVVRQAAAEALAKVGPKAVPALLEVLKDKSPLAREVTANALRLMGPAAKE